MKDILYMPIHSIQSDLDPDLVSISSRSDLTPESEMSYPIFGLN